jgi:hypothetical protein
MTRSNDSFARNADAAGTTLLATHAPGDGKEYPVTMLAGPSGHLEGSLDTWLLTIPPQAVAASKLHFDVFNADAAKIVKVRGAWVIVAQDVANTGAVSIRLDWFRTSSVGTGGTAAVSNATTPVAAFSPKDTLNATLPAGVTARAAATAGAASSAFMFPTFHATEELQVHGGLSQWFNVLPDPERGEQELILRQNQGLKAVQGTVVGAGSIGFLVSFTVE